MPDTPTRIVDLTGGLLSPEALERVRADFDRAQALLAAFTPPSPEQIAEMTRQYELMVAAAPSPPPPALLANLERQYTAAMAAARAASLYDPLTRACAL